MAFIFQWDLYKSARDRLVMLPKWFGMPFITARGFFDGVANEFAGLQPFGSRSWRG